MSNRFASRDGGFAVGSDGTAASAPASASRTVSGTGRNAEGRCTEGHDVTRELPGVPGK